MPGGWRTERRDLARARRATFHDPPTRRNRVWQTDFSELETLAGGTWQLGGVVDYAAKFLPACPVTATKTWREAVGALEAARERAGEVLGAPLMADLVDRGTGELHPIRVVTDNGPCYKAARSRATSPADRSSSTSAPATGPRRPTGSSSAGTSR